MKQRAVNAALDWLRRELARAQSGVTVPAKRVCRRVGDGMIKTAWIRVGKSDGNLHQFTATISRGLCLAFFPWPHNRRPGHRWREQSSRCTSHIPMGGGLLGASV